MGLWWLGYIIATDPSSNLYPKPICLFKFPLQAGREVLIPIWNHQMMTWPQSSWQESVPVLLVCLIDML